jgi:hypothetical protein
MAASTGTVQHRRRLHKSNIIGNFITKFSKFLPIPTGQETSRGFPLPSQGTQCAGTGTGIKKVKR